MSNDIKLTKADANSLMRGAPRMPSIPSSFGTDPKAMIGAIKEILEVREGQRGSPLDKSLTWRDLFSQGVIALNIDGQAYFNPPSGGVVPAPANNGTIDQTPPPAPTGLEAVGALASIIVTWDKPIYGPHSHTEIWSSGTNDIGTAQLIGTSPSQIYVDVVGSGTVRYYWIKWVSKFPVTGPFNGTTGTRGETGYDASYLLDVLSANPPPGVNYNPLLWVNADPNLVVDGVPIPLGTYMQSAYIADGSITRLKVGLAAIDDARIANLHAAKITAGDIDADRMRANIVQAILGQFQTLSAITAYLGTATIGVNGYLRSEGAVSYSSGNGFWMGYDAGTYKFRLGNPAGGHGLFWDGSTLSITGDLYSTGNGTFRGTFIAGNAESLYPPGGQDGVYAGSDGFFVGRGYTALGSAPNSEAFFRMDRGARSIVAYAQDITIQNGWPTTKWVLQADGNAFFQNINVDSITVRNVQAPGGVKQTLSLSANTSDPNAAPSTQVQFTVSADTDVVMYLRARGPNAGHGYACITNYQPTTSLQIYDAASGGSYEQGFNGAFLTAAADPGGGAMLATRLQAGTYWFSFVLIVPDAGVGPTDMSACLKSLL